MSCHHAFITQHQYEDSLQNFDLKFGLAQNTYNLNDSYILAQNSILHQIFTHDNGKMIVSSSSVTKFQDLLIESIYSSRYPWN